MWHVFVFVNIFLRNFLKRFVLNFFKTTNKNINYYYHFFTPITLNSARYTLRFAACSATGAEL